MIDWEGLLKFSLSHTDGTKKSEFKEMTKHDQKWLEEAMNSYCNSEIEQMQNILKDIQTENVLNDEEVLMVNLETLQDILDSLDRGNILYKLGGHIQLLKIIFYSKFTNCRVLSLQIFSSVNQNDAMIQTDSINTGALEIMDLIQKEKNIKVREAMMGAISSMIRGENLEVKRIFIKNK